MTKVLFDDLDENFDDIECIDEIFDNSQAKEQYVVCGYAERWDRHGKKNTAGWMPYVFTSVAEAISRTASDYGICYTKITEEKYGRLKFEISHHDGHCDMEIREVTKKGNEIYNREYHEDIAAEKIVKQKGATRNVKWVKRMLGGIND